MKQKWRYLLLAALAALCLAWQGASLAAPGELSVLAFPFAQVGQGLRALSLAGTLGNGAAWVLYLALCLAPLGALAALRRRGRAVRADGLLALLSALLLPVLYGMVNPGWLAGWFAQGLAEMAPAAAGLAVWALLVAWAVLRLLAALEKRTTAQLQAGLDGLLTAVQAVLVWAVLGSGLGQLVQSVRQLYAGNTAAGRGALTATAAFLAVGWLVESLPCLLDIAIAQGAARLLAAARTARYAPQTVAAAQRLAARCKSAIGAAVLVQAGYDLLQLLVGRSLYSMAIRVNLPLGALALAVAALVLARWLAEGQAIQEENQAFV